MHVYQEVLRYIETSNGPDRKFLRYVYKEKYWFIHYILAFIYIYMYIYVLWFLYFVYIDVGNSNIPAGSLRNNAGTNRGVSAITRMTKSAEDDSQVYGASKD